jgi:glycosyltransferase involved in cell wall biosynthesis
MKILMLIADPFNPDARVYSEALSLVEDGHTVTVLAWDRETKYPLEETIDNINIIRIRTYYPARSATLHFFKLREFWREAYKKARNLDLDVINAHDLDALPLGIRLKKRCNKPLIYDVNDIYPYMIAFVVPAIVVKFVEKMERLWLRYVDRLLIASEGFKEYYIKAGFDHARIKVIFNCKEQENISAEETQSLKRALGAEDKFLIMYIGALEKRRFIAELLNAFDQLDEDMVLVIGGFGELYGTVAERVNNCTSGRVKFIGFVHPKDVIAYTKCADVIFGLYHPAELNQILTMPVKVLDAMTAGVPVIINQELNACKLVKEHNFGLCIPYDISAFFDAVRELKSNPWLCKLMGENAQQLGQSVYNWDLMSMRLKEIYKEVGKPLG